MPHTMPPNLPWLLRSVWAKSDPNSAMSRWCDAEGNDTTHRRIVTVAGPYWVCGECGQLHLEAPPTDATDHYDDIWRRKIEHFKPSAGDLAECRRWMDRISPYKQRGRLFEVGSGLGLLLKAASDDGWRPSGIELSPVAASFAAEHSAADVATGAVEDIELDAREYDVILCNNVFEHLREPRRVLINLSRGLRPGGVIFFQTLSAQSLSVHFSPTHWLYYGTGHLFIPTLKSLDAYFRAAGLRIVSSETHGFRALPWDYEKKRRRKGRFDKPMAALASRIGRGHRVKMLLQKEREPDEPATES